MKYDLSTFTSIISTHCVSSSTKDTTTSRGFIFTFFCKSLWKQMAMYTMSFFGIYSHSRISTKHVFFLSNKFKMFWITTRSIFTEMIENKNIFTISSTWDWFNKPSISKSMYSVCLSFITKIPITKFTFSTSPIPTFSNWVNLYFRQKPFFIRLVEFEF